MFVPVISMEGSPLMPTTSRRARILLSARKAVAFWSRGVFCVRMRVPTQNKVQSVAVGVDPGSKKEGYTVKSESHTYLNIQSDAVQHVGRAVDSRRYARQSRRYRNTPCRRQRSNRKHSGSTIPPSTLARWQLKLNVCKWLKRLFPVTEVAVEDVSARTVAGTSRWNVSFSPLMVGKNWFYAELTKVFTLTTYQGYDTHEMRRSAGLKKSTAKLANRFDSHCVDSWVLANAIVGGHVTPDNMDMVLLTPKVIHRRQLQRFQPSTGGERQPYGGSRSLGLKRGSDVLFRGETVCYVGGSSNGRLSLHHVSTGRRFTQSAKPEECCFISYNPWRVRPVPESDKHR